MAKSAQSQPPIEIRQFRSSEELDRAVAKLKRRIAELESLDISRAVYEENGEDDVAVSAVRTTILEIFGENSPEYRQHRYIDIWSGAMFVDMSKPEIEACRLKGRLVAVNVLNGLIKRLNEIRLEFVAPSSSPAAYFDKLNLHPRISDAASDLFRDGHHWQAVFDASKALINYVKERSGRHELDGTPLVRTVFSKNNPTLALNNLVTQTDQDEQEGIMHLFEGAVLAIRNPGGHSFPEGSEQRAIEYISLLSMLAYLVQESKKNVRKSS